jgi:hypothetical protein
MRVVKAFGLLNIGLLTALAGCNPNDFQSALDKAPVAAFGNGSSTGSLFVLPLSAPTAGTVAARMLVSRVGDAYLALAEYDKDGKVAILNASDSDLSNLGNVPVSSAASLGPAGPILLGTPSFNKVGDQPAAGRVSLLTLNAPGDGTAAFAIQPRMTRSDHVGIGVAAGKITGDPASPGEFVVLSDDTVYLLSGSDQSLLASTSCQAVQQIFNPSAGPYAYRPLAVGDLLTGGGDEIVLAGMGRVIFLQYDRATSTLVCAAKSLSQGAMANFGSSLTVADFDGDGNMDLAIGTPPDRVYVYFGPIDTAGDFVMIGSGGSSDFGKHVASLPMPAPAGARLMVSDPSAWANGRSGAGKVMVVNLNRGESADVGATPDLVTLFDSSEDSPAGVFGDNLGTVEFNTGVCTPGGGPSPLPWVSSGTAVLAYFNTPVSTELRCSK